MDLLTGTKEQGKERLPETQKATKVSRMWSYNLFFLRFGIKYIYQVVR